MSKHTSNSFFAILLALVIAVDSAAVTITGNTGPGGYEAADGASDLELWLRADQGVFTDDGFGGVNGPATDTDPVRQWQDQSGNANHANQTTGTQQALLTTTALNLNGQRAIAFDGVNDVFTTSATNNANISVFVAYANRVGTGSGDRGTFYSTSASNDPLQRNTVIWQDSSVGAMGLSENLNANNLLSLVYDYNAFGVGSGDFRGYLDGDLVGTRSPGNNTLNTGALFLGARTGNSEFLDADVAEIAVFHRTLNAAERIIVNNNLSSKYDTAGGTDDRYSGDTALNGEYDFDVFGIGATNPGSGLVSVDSAGMEGFGIEADSVLADTEFVLAGHKTLTNSIVTTDLPDKVIARWDRVWFVDETNAAGSTDTVFSFDFSDAGLASPSGSNWKLLYSPTNAFNFSVLDITPTVTDDLFQFELASSLLQDGYFTLGQGAPIPEPSSFLLLGLGCCGLLLHRRRRSGGRTDLAMDPNNVRSFGSNAYFSWSRNAPKQSLPVIAVALFTCAIAAPAGADLIVHYKFDEGSGTSAADSNGSAEDGTLVNMEAGDWVAGFIGASALSFDGVDERVTTGAPLPANLNSIGSGDFSISAWINTTDASGNVLAIGGDFGSSAASNHGLTLSTAGLSLRDGSSGITSSTVTASFGTAVTTGSWVHIVGVRDGGTLRVYRNGSADGTAAYDASIDVSGSNLGGGLRQMTVGLALKPSDLSIKAPFAGLIDDVGVWDSVLTPEEIADIFQFGLQGNDLSFVPPPIPEPSGITLVALGLIGVASRRRRKRQG